MNHNYLLIGIIGILLFSIISGCSSSSFNRNHTGAFLTEDNQLISIRKSEGNTLRYRIFQTGETGRLYPINDTTYTSGQGFSSKEPEVLRVEYIFKPETSFYQLNWIVKDKASIRAHVINQEEWVNFNNGVINLNGRLTLPDGEGPFPAVVLVHGSGDDKATDYYHNGDFFAAHGIATLTYDKRGTGDSEGIYTFDYHKLASDVIAGVEYLQSREEINPDQIGLSGYSQGGWVAPLAASMSDNVSYVIVNYGMIESGYEEARLETRNTMREKGVDVKYFDQIDSLTLATVKVVASGFKESWDEVDKLDKKYKNAPWRKSLQGTTVHEFLKYPKWIVKLIGPGRAPFEMDWKYESTPILDSLNIPITWLLAEHDTQAPNELTIPKIREYQLNGKPYDLYVFPKTDHGMLQYEEVNGKRMYSKYDPDYFAKEVECIFNMMKI